MTTKARIDQRSGRLHALIALFLAGCTAIAASAAESTLQRFTFTEPHMGTPFKIIVYAADEPTASTAAKAAFRRVAYLDASMSDYRSTSELMRLCARAGGEPVAVSPELFFVLSRALSVSRLSDGAFDVTVGPVVRLWRRCRRTQRLPEPEQLAAARALVGYQNIRLDAAKQTVQLLKPGMQLDLGGIAKGYAADEALQVLREHGIDRALVAAGGDIAVSGPPPESPKGWTIAIAPVGDAERQRPRGIFLSNGAVSTSGDAEQHVVIDGIRYSHIVDPKTGLGLTDPLSVTVVARRGIDSDSLTKIVSVLGPERGLKILEGVEGVSARAVRLTPKGTRVFVSEGFPDLAAYPQGTE